MGQLLVVARHTVAKPSSCYEPELIPDPVCWKWRWLSQPMTIACHKMLDLGSVIMRKISALRLAYTLRQVLLLCIL